MKKITHRNRNSYIYNNIIHIFNFNFRISYISFYLSVMNCCIKNSVSIDTISLMKSISINTIDNSGFKNINKIFNFLIVKFYTFFCRHRFVSKCIKTYVLYMRLY